MGEPQEAQGQITALTTGAAADVMSVTVAPSTSTDYLIMAIVGISFSPRATSSAAVAACELEKNGTVVAQATEGLTSDIFEATIPIDALDNATGSTTFTMACGLIEQNDDSQVTTASSGSSTLIVQPTG